MATDLVFQAPNNVTDFFDMMGYLNNLTDVGQGGMFWTIMLIVFAGVLFLMMKAYSVEKASAITFISSFIVSLLLRWVGWVNDFVVTVTVILCLLGIYLLVKESEPYD